MADVFGYDTRSEPTAVFSNEQGTLTIGGKELALVQNWQVQYQQTVQEIFELGSNALYWAKGRPIGQAQLGRIVGVPGPFPSGDVCKGGETFTIKNTTGVCKGEGGQLDLTMVGAVLVSVGFSSSVETIPVMEQVGIKFASLEQGS